MYIQDRGGSRTVQRQPLVEQTDYQRSLIEGLDPPALNANNVRYWSDFNRVYHHPRSIVQVYETEMNPEQRSFDMWQTGDELFNTLDREYDLFDRDLRPFIEECDQMQGLQMLTTVESGWGGFSARYLDRLRDEFGKSSIWVWALGEGQAQTSVSLKTQRLRCESGELLAHIDGLHTNSSYSVTAGREDCQRGSCPV